MDMKNSDSESAHTFSYLFALLFAVLATGQAVAGQTSPFNSQATQVNAGPTRLGKLDFYPCELQGQGSHKPRSAQCAWLQVPQDPDRPEGKSRKLFVARLAARNAQSLPDPLVAIAGGPGQAASQAFARLDHMLWSLAGRRDIYLLDARGTGRSDPQSCGLDADQARLFEFDPARIREQAQNCLEQLERPPRFDTTSVAVRDLDALRQALGLAQWNLFGVSYGTRVVQHYMRRYPAAVRAVVLDGVVPPEEVLGPDIALHSQEALDAFLAGCVQHHACHETYPNLQQELEQLFAQLSPEPRKVHYEDLRTGELKSIQFGASDLAVLVRLALYNTEHLSTLPPMLKAAYQDRNYSALARMSQMLSEQMDQAMAFAMHNSVVCTEDVPFYRISSAQLGAIEQTYLGSNVLEGLKAICEVWPAGYRDRDLNQPLLTGIPSLLLSGERDPITPPVYAERAAKGLSNSRHLVAKGQGHGVFSIGCMPEVIAQFVETVNPNDLDTDCLKPLTAAPVFLNMNGPGP